jgi:hypothetical protein
MTTATAPKKFHRAVREQIWTLTGLAGGTGSGKTYSALELATGMAGGERFAMIDTENGRGRHYADLFDYDIADLEAPFRPDRYADAIEAAAREGYPVIVVDSFSHEHAGDGGLLDWHEEEFQRLGGRDAVKMTAWIQPKRAHKKMMTRLLQTNAHLIICLRAEEKVEMIKDENNKWVIVPKRSLVGTDGWVPIAEKNLPYELTTSFLLKADRPGFPIPIKLEEQHKKLVPLDMPLGRASGAALAAWAAGGKREPAAEGPTVPSPEAADPVGPALATNEQKLAVVNLAGARGMQEDQLRDAVEKATGRRTLRGAVTHDDLVKVTAAVMAHGTEEGIA